MAEGINDYPDAGESLTARNKFWINVIETNYFRMNDPLRVPVSRSMTVRDLLIHIVDTYSKSITILSVE